MVDPDAPSRTNPTNALWVHWICANIPNNSSSGTSSSQDGHDLFGYVGAGPPKGTGYHRYIFALFSHDHKLELKGHDHNIPENQATGRSKFNIVDFMKRYHLGTCPLIVESFEAQWDECKSHFSLYYSLTHNRCSQIV